MKKVTGKALSAAFLLCSIMLVMPGIADAEDIRLIIRADDMGMTQGSLVAFERALNKGVATCASVMVSAPWFEGAAELCRKNPGWCTGIHLTIVGEWRGYRWRPVLPWDNVSSLVDEDGFFYPSFDELYAHDPKHEEIEAEMRAQIDLAMKKGINVQYIDTHYGHPSHLKLIYPEMIEIVEKIGHDYNIPVSTLLGEKHISIFTVPPEQKKDTAVKLLEKLEPGLWLWVCHPGIDSPEQRALIHTSPRFISIEGKVGAGRTEVLNTVTSMEVKSIILKKGIKLINYIELLEEKNK